MTVRQTWLLLCVGLPLLAQTRISLGGANSGRSELERAGMRLAHEDTRAAAITALRQAGVPAVPVLVALAQRGDAASTPALRVLAELGGLARSAVPALQRLATANGPQAAAAAEALAAIGERDTVVLTDWNGDHVVELDAEGKELRRVAVQKPWTVQPIANDRLLVGCFAQQKVVELGWDGKVAREFALPKGPMQARRTVDGRTLVATEERLFVFDADGKEIAALAGSIRQFAVLDDDSFLLMGAGERGFERIRLSGDKLEKFPVAGSAMGFHRSANGHLHVVGDGGGGRVLDATGQEMSKLPAGGWCVQALPDGRVFLAGSNGIALYGADSKEQWQQRVGQVGFLVARFAPAGN